MSDARNYGRSFLAIFLGCMAANVLFLLVENIGMNISPPPTELIEQMQSGTDDQKKEALDQIIAQASIGAMTFVLLAWTVGTFAGGWIATRIAPYKPIGHAALTGVCLLSGVIINFIQIPHPTLLMVASAFIFVPVALLGGWFGKHEENTSKTDKNRIPGEHQSDSPD